MGRLVQVDLTGRLVPSLLVHLENLPVRLVRFVHARLLDQLVRSVQLVRYHLVVLVVPVTHLARVFLRSPARL